MNELTDHEKELEELLESVPGMKEKQAELDLKLSLLNTEEKMNFLKSKLEDNLKKLKNSIKDLQDLLDK